MIDREKLKDRINEFSSHLNMDEYALFNLVDYKPGLLEGKIYFTGDRQYHKVDFKNIDFTGPEVDHQEWRAQLNRYLWLGTCLAEDKVCSDGFYAKIAMDTINAFYNFREGVEIPDKEFLWKKLGDNTLSISVRLGRRYGSGWWGTVPFMRKSVITDEFLETMYSSTLDQVDFMINHMTSAGNWRISQLSSLLFLGYIFDNEEWIRISTKGLNEAFEHQVGADGSHEEHTLGYHKWMTKEFSSYFYLSRGIPSLKLKIDINKLIRMWEYIILASCPDGQATGLNDDKRWGFVNTEKVVKAYFDAIDSHRKLVKGFTDTPYRDIRNDSAFYEDAGQWYLRNEENRETELLVFDGTKYGGGHCHKAVNSVSFYTGGRMILTDPGTFNYERKDPFCKYGRETQSHNSVVLDGLCQTKSSLLESAGDIEGRCVFVHNAFTGGYTDGDRSSAGIHERLVIWYKGRFCIINDSIVGSGSGFTANFNFLPSDYKFDGTAFSTGFGDRDILVKPIYSNVPIDQKVYEGSLEPMAGWLAKDGYTQMGGEPGCSMHVNGDVKEFGTIVSYALVPFDNGVIPDVKMLNHDELAADEEQDIKSRIYNKPVKYSIEVSGIRYDILTGFSKYRDSRLSLPVGRTGGYESDGKLALVEFNDDKPVFVYIYDGTYLKYGDRMLMEEEEFGNYEKNL
jgi:hypothetical protein